MAKKIEKVEPINGIVPAEEVVITTTQKDEKSLSDHSLFDLINLEKACALICRRYENNIKMYDGSIRQSGYEYEKYRKINNLHSNILNEIEKRLEIMA